MTITGLVHVNVNCSNFERSKTFYELLGFEHMLDVPPTNTPEVAAAVGMPPYRVNGELLILRGRGAPFVLDLLEWQEPTDPAPPYPHLYHLGIARIALSTDDLEGDMARLQAAGVEFLSEPVSLTLGDQKETTFVCFRDPDGTILELVQSVPPESS
ncbi:MAG: VOC family protein [Acidimicrobiales bacterium]|jgi:glyoxylase I family protein|nr:VOC family protein [Acidimicrobiales bacterium]